MALCGHRADSIVADCCILRAATTAARAGDLASSAADTAYGTARSAYNTAADTANYAYETAADGANRAYDTTTAAGMRAYDTGRETVDSAAQAGRETIDAGRVRVERGADDLQRGYEMVRVGSANCMCTCHSMPRYNGWVGERTALTGS